MPFRKNRRLGLNKGYKGMTYKKRCQLAIEYIEKMEKLHFDYFYEKQELLKILKGDDKDE